HNRRKHIELCVKPMFSMWLCGSHYSSYMRRINLKSQDPCIVLSSLLIFSSSSPALFYTPVDRTRYSFRFYLFPGHTIPIHCSHKKRSACIVLFLHQFVSPLCVPGSHKNDNKPHRENFLSVFL